MKKQYKKYFTRFQNQPLQDRVTEKTVPLQYNRSLSRQITIRFPLQVFEELKLNSQMEGKRLSAYVRDSLLVHLSKPKANLETTAGDFGHSNSYPKMERQGLKSTQKIDHDPFWDLFDGDQSTQMKPTEEKQEAIPAGYPKDIEPRVFDPELETGWEATPTDEFETTLFAGPKTESAITQFEESEGWFPKQPQGFIHNLKAPALLICTMAVLSFLGLQAGKYCVSSATQPPTQPPVFSEAGTGPPQSRGEESCILAVKGPLATVELNPNQVSSLAIGQTFPAFVRFPETITSASNHNPQRFTLHRHGAHGFSIHALPKATEAGSSGSVWVKLVTGEFIILYVTVTEPGDSGQTDVLTFTKPLDATNRSSPQISDY